MKTFLKKSSAIFLSFILALICASWAYAITSADDSKPTKLNVSELKVVKKDNSVLKKSKTAEKNYYSNSIRVLVTDKQKEKIQSTVKEMNDEINMLAKVIYREARGESQYYQSAVAWCVLNRVDAKGYGNTIKKVITSPNQFAWYPDTPITKTQKRMAKDVVIRWLLEKEGFEEVGRTLPKSYKFFSGDGVHNYFRKEFNSTTFYDWSLESPY